jgi:HTH-type transcriptional regulator / antitoxin HipB
MRIHSIAELAATARGRRLELGLTQAELAERTGISRKWVYQFESGKTTTELALVIRLLEALGLNIEITQPATANLSAEGTLTGGASTNAPAARQVNLDALLEDYGRP